MLRALNAALTGLARRHGALVADVHGWFLGHGATAGAPVPGAVPARQPQPVVLQPHRAQRVGCPRDPPHLVAGPPRRPLTTDAAAAQASARACQPQGQSAEDRNGSCAERSCSTPRRQRGGERGRRLPEGQSTGARLPPATTRSCAAAGCPASAPPVAARSGACRWTSLRRGATDKRSPISGISVPRVRWSRKIQRQRRIGVPEHFSSGRSSLQVPLAVTWRDRQMRPTVGFRSIAGTRSWPSLPGLSPAGRCPMTTAAPSTALATI